MVTKRFFVVDGAPKDIELGLIGPFCFPLDHCWVKPDTFPGSTSITNCCQYSCDGVRPELGPFAFSCILKPEYPFVAPATTISSETTTVTSTSVKGVQLLLPSWYCQLPLSAWP